MKTSAAQKIKIGLFTVVGILLFIVGIFLIGSKKNIFSSTYMIYGTFNNVGGLEIGNNIRFAGINVGTVEDIRMVTDTSVRVEMRIKQDAQPFMKADAVATIGSDGIMGDKLIMINSGSANETKLLKEGARIATVNPMDFDKIITKLTNVADNAEIITGELAGMAIQIREGNGTISKLLYTDDLSRSLEGTAANAQKITGSLAGIAAHIQSGKGSLGALIYTDSLSNGLDRTVVTANAAMGTIQEAAGRFSENMKALQGNYFLRGYFKRKASEKQDTRDSIKTSVTEELGAELSEEELEEVIKEAQKELELKKKKK